MASFSRAHGWSREEVITFLIGVRKDLNNPSIHAYNPMWVFLMGTSIRYWLLADVQSMERSLMLKTGKRWLLSILYFLTYASKYQEIGQIAYADTVVYLIYGFAVYDVGHFRPKLMLLGYSTVCLSYPYLGIWYRLLLIKTRILTRASNLYLCQGNQ